MIRHPVISELSIKPIEELHYQSHIARDLDLASHECLHRIELVIVERCKVLRIHADRYIWLGVLCLCDLALALGYVQDPLTPAFARKIQLDQSLRAASLLW